MILIVKRSQENKIINIGTYLYNIVNRFKTPMNIKYHKEIKLYFEIKIESFHENTDNNVDISIYLSLIVLIIRNTKFVIIYY
jgi:hypothetical protein